jgi:hypothetical protein
MRRYGRTGDPDFNLDQPHSLLVKVETSLHQSIGMEIIDVICKYTHQPVMAEGLR